MTIARTLAEWALPLALDDVPPEVRRDACLHLLDGIGCAVAAGRTNAAPYAVAAALQMGGPPEASIIGDASRVGAPAAALANGVLIHALDFDDTHGDALVHATAAVLPAAFAAGEEVSASGADVLAAAIAGYEAVIRIGAAVKHGFHERGFHATSVCGVFASALVASKLMGLTVAQTVSALGIAGSAAAGSLEFLHTGSMTKQLHPGLASMNGIVAARLAAAGAEGPETIFEGEYGLFRAYLGVDVDPASVTKTLGFEWEVSNVAIKRYPACHLSIASLEALWRLKIEKTNDIESIVFQIPYGSVPIVCEPAAEKRKPRTAYEAKFSLPFSAAALLIDGRLTVDSFAPDALSRSDVLELAAKVGYEPLRESFDGAPAAAPGYAEVRYRDGSTVRNDEPAYAAGRHSAIDEPDLLDKFRANGGTREMENRVLKIAELPNVRGLLA